MTTESTTPPQTNPKADKAGKRDEGGLWDSVKTIVYALGLALILRIFLFQPYTIPSESMRPKLLVGDYIFVSKWDYGYSRASIPFEPPLFSGRIPGGLEPGRGDVVVFKLPSDGRTDYIKRVLGLPGDRIQVTGGALYINGQAVEREPLDDEVLRDRWGNVTRVTRWRETLPGGKSYVTYDLESNGRLDDTGEYVVPPGHYFMMGDNRDNSIDSRVPPEVSGVGYVPAQNLVGRARLVFVSFDETTSLFLPWTWFTGLRLDRMAEPIE
jgi:signal peptidase I